jgi:hypothetical protein
MSTTEPPTSEVKPPRTWRSRLRSRGAVITGVVAALVVIGGVTAALLLPDHDRGRFGPGFDRAGWSGGAPWEDGRHGPMGMGIGDHGPGGERFGGPGQHGFGFGDEPVVTGTVASVANGSIVVNVDGAGQRTIRTDNDTRVGGSSNGGLGDLQVGERVVVEVEGTGDAATVTSVEGLTVTVNTTALSQKPAVGDVVVLTGTADAGTIRADGIRVLPKAS